ncbi:SDR family NAD(P)-dependent oxidoreductase [Chthonobacter rhizosphaerae]|uniref:SDR family NAD(P)-dependent oxidoreductase n=1 Tax=Chthonobacter rhizosphaerae TaxID=2735553 RepID=UPI0015EFA36D|nr:SDR family oxidoreductase [Chthonobacter rhizosphaerae]
MAGSEPRDSSWAARFGAYALVTGASDGIGRALAVDLAGRGQNLVLVARRGPVLDALAADLRGTRGIDVRVLALDLAAPDAIWTLAAATETLDIGLLVTAAGYGRSGPFLSADRDGETDMLAVNCRAVLECTHVFAGRMAARGRGGIVLLSSLVAFQGVPHAATYAASKAWVQAFAEGIAPELAGRGVSVLAAAPGPVRTGFGARAGMTMAAADSPDAVARAILAALGRRRTVRPGRLSKVLGWGLATLPRPLRSTIMGRIMKGMTAEADGEQTDRDATREAA